MAHSWVHKDRGELRIYENLNELSTDLADYIAELSEVSVKERGVFAIALSGGSLIDLMGYQCFAFQCFILFYILLYDSFLYLVLKFRCKAENCMKLLTTRLLTGLNGIYFGRMSVWWQRTILIAIIS